MSILTEKLIIRRPNGNIVSYNLYSDKRHDYDYHLCKKLNDGSIGYCPLIKTNSDVSYIKCKINDEIYQIDPNVPEFESLYTSIVFVNYSFYVPHLKYEAGHYEQVWHEGCYKYEWIDGYYEMEWVDAYTDSTGQFISGHYENVWINGHYGQVWHEGYYENVWYDTVNETGTATLTINSTTVNIFYKNGTFFKTMTLPGVSVRYNISGLDIQANSLISYYYSFDLGYNLVISANLTFSPITDITDNGEISIPSCQNY